MPNFSPWAEEATFFRQLLLSEASRVFSSSWALLGAKGREARQAGKRENAHELLAQSGERPQLERRRQAAGCLSAALPVGAKPQGERRRPDCAKGEDGQTGSGGEEPGKGSGGLPALPLCHPSPPPSRLSAPACQSALLRNSLEFRES